MKKKVLILHHGTGIGGALIALVGLIQELKEKHEVEVLSIFDGIAVDYLRDRGISVKVPKSSFYRKFYAIHVHSEASYITLIEWMLKLKSLFAFFLNKYFFAKNELKDMVSNYDIFYLNSIFVTDWCLAAKQQKKDIKIVVHVREPLAKDNFLFQYSIIRNNVKKYSEKVIAVSKDNASRLNLLSKTTVVYDPVVNRTSAVGLGEDFDKGFKYFVYLGGDSRIKGFEQLANSLDFLDEDVRIFFLGGEAQYSGNKFKSFIRGLVDGYYNRLKGLKSKVNSSDSIIKVGLTDNVFSYYRNSIALIAPFAKPHACLPVLEAFSMGLPVIASDIDGMDEIVDENNGCMFRNGNSNDLSQKINFMAQGIADEDYLQMRDNALLRYNAIKKNNPNIADILDIL